MSAPAPSEFASLLRSFRGRAALTQEELAERAGLAVNAIGSLERGIRTRPYPHTVRSLAVALALSDDERTRLIEAAQGRRAGADAAAPGIIGREVEAEHVATLLGSGRARLVTLTGPGGVGKTTLATAIVARLTEEFPDEARVVDASTITDPAVVLATLATAFGLAESDTPLAGLTERLRDGPAGTGRPVLIVLDNLEQVPGVGPSLATLIEQCPSVRLLTTSRAPLRVRAEYEVLVPPLPVPDAWLRPEVATVAAAPAVRLLLARCASMGRPVELTTANAAVVAELCRRVEGLPLAIELIAAQVRAIPMESLLARLEQALEQPGPRDLPERQRTLRATLEWSMSLLDERERAVFLALGAFSGSFTLAAAEVVLDDATDTVFVLSALVEQSLVVLVPGGERVARYRLLEPVRQYAVRATPVAIRTAHADHFLDGARRSWDRLRGPELAAELDVVDLDHANLSAAHQLLVDADRHAEAVELVHGIALGVVLRGRAREWRDRLELSAPDDLPTAARGRRAAAAGLLDYALTGPVRAAAQLIEGQRLAAESGHDLVAADAALFASLASLNLGDVAQARRSAAVVRGGHGAWATVMLGLVDGQLGILLGNLDTAADRLAEAGTAALAFGNPLLVCMSLNMRATVTERRGDLVETCRLLVASVERCVGVRMGWPLAFALPALAGVAMRLDEPQVAGRLLGAAASFTGAADLLGVFPASRERSTADIEALRTRLGQRFGATVEAGRLLELDEVARLARNLVPVEG